MNKYTIVILVILKTFAKANITKNEIKQHIKLEKDALIMLIGGKHIGHTGIIESIEGDVVKFTADDKQTHQTNKRYAYPLGVKKPIINLS